MNVSDKSKNSTNSLIVKGSFYICIFVYFLQIYIRITIVLINHHTNDSILFFINLFTLSYTNNPYYFELQLILLTIYSPGIACPKSISNFFNCGHELILSPTAPSMLNVWSTNIIKRVYMRRGIIDSASLLWPDVSLLHYQFGMML